MGEACEVCMPLCGGSGSGNEGVWPTSIHPVLAIYPACTLGTWPCPPGRGPTGWRAAPDLLTLVG